jgi:hypothetical protein
MVRHGGMRMRTFARHVVLPGVVLTLVALPTPAQATHEYDGMVPTQNYNLVCYGTTLNDARVCQTDNANLYWYADSADPGELEADDKDALRTMLANQYVPTDLAVNYDSSPVFSGSGETDLIYQEAESALPLPSGILGVTWCNDDVDGELFQCDQTYVRIVSPDGYRRYHSSIACHETGHAVGLVHGDDAYPALDPGDLRLGCMVNEDQFPTNLGTDSTHLINLTY